MSQYHYVVTAQKPTAVVACVTGELENAFFYDKSMLQNGY